MAALDELRKQYPDLQGLDDDQTVDAVHQAFYSDLPRADVAAKLGIKLVPPPAEPSSLMRRAADYGLSAVQGAIQVPQAAVGLADLATGGRVGKALENEGGTFGFRPDEANAYLESLKSPEQQKASKNVADASQGDEGDDQALTSKIGRVAVAALKNPSVVAQTVVQSLPSMMAGGVLGRGALWLGLSAADKAAILALPVAEQAGAIVAASRVGAGVAGGIGEGVTTMGQQAEQIRTDDANPDRLLTGKQVALAAGSGAVTGLIGMGSGTLAQKLGIENAENLLVGAHADPAAAHGLVRRVIGGAVTEGLLEEFPQSVQEQVAQNVATNQPWDKDVDQQAVLGALSGGAMGMGAQVFHGEHTPGKVLREDIQPATGPLSTAANIGTTINATVADAHPTPTAPAPTPPELADALLKHANVRAAELETKAAGTKEETDAKTGKVTPAVEPVFLTPAEQAEHDFLKDHGGNADALARAYHRSPEDTIAAIERQGRQDVADQRDFRPEPPIAEPPPRAAAPVEDDANPAPLDGDILANYGGPFKSRIAAVRAQNTQLDPAAVAIASVDGGWVLRPLAAAAKMVDDAAHQAATSPTNDLAEPTQGQKEANNYRLGHINWNGLDLSFENPKGSERKGIDPNGKPWSVTMPAHYGYVRSTVGADGDHVDIYMGDHPESGHVFVVDQQDAHTGKWDEHKAILGASSLEEATKLYDAGFSDGKGEQRRSAITPMSVDEFKTWLRDGDTTKPIGKVAGAQVPEGASPGSEDRTRTTPEAPAPAAAPAEPPHPNARTRKVATRVSADEQRADYFTPGNIVKGYGGFDEVLAYSPPDANHSWSVKVQRVNKVGDEWVREGKPQDARTHATEPEVRNVADGPVARLGHVLAAEVKYSEPRADRKPFPNAPDRGIAEKAKQATAPVPKPDSESVASAPVAAAPAEPKFPNARTQAVAAKTAAAAEQPKETVVERRKRLVAERVAASATPGAVLETSPLGRVFDWFGHLGDKPGNARQGIRDAESSTNVKLGLVAIPDRSLPAETIAQFNLATRTISYNPAQKLTRAEWAQAMAEELMHAVDATDRDRTISSTSERFAADGDIGAEARALFESGKGLADYLKYPLDPKYAFGSHRIQAELFARLAVIYHGDQALMRRELPIAYEAYHDLFGTTLLGAGSRVLRDVRADSGRDVAQSRADGERAGIAGGLGRGDRQQEADQGLGALRRRAAQILRADPTGGVVDFTSASTVSLSKALADSLGSVKDVNLPAGYKVADLLDSNGKLGWWHKTVGSMYNLAQRSPEFKRVYDAVQRFIGDTSYYANEAANLAPKILPKLDGWRDIGKSPISAADSKAIAAPIFQGTLEWTRDANGKPVRLADMRDKADTMTGDEKGHALFTGGHISEQVLKMWQGLPIQQFEDMIDSKYERDVMKAGVVWTDAELKSMFNATPGQMSLYREFRAATDKSLTNLAISEMLNYAGDDVSELHEQALALDHDKAAELLRDHLFELAAADPARAELLNETANKMIDVADHASDMQKRGYAPLSRFGAYTLEATLPTGERYFSLFETSTERAKMVRTLTAARATTITTGTMSQEDYKLLNGVSPETISLFGEMLGLQGQGDEAKDLAFQTYLKRGIANRSAMKRLLARQGIAGFSEDAARVLAGFVYSNGRRTSSNLHMGEMTQATSEVSKQAGQLKDAAVKLTEYVKNPQEEAAGLKGLLFAQYLGGSVASAMVNATQPFTVTFPYLSQFGGITKAAKQMAAAVKTATQKTTGDAALDKALHRAEEMGVVAPQETHQLMAQAQGRAALKSGDGTLAGNAQAKAANVISKLQMAWGKVFSVAEQYNRRVTFIAAYRTALAQGIANPEAFAIKAVNETQFVANKGNRPEWARGAVGGVLFTFKSYSIQYLELLSRMATAGEPGSAERAAGRKAALLAVAVLFMMGGADGLPFEADIEDLIDGFMQHMGYNFSSKRHKQELFARLLGAEGGRFLNKGLSGLPGIPIDVSGRMGMGNLIPGTGLLTKKSDYGSDVAELFGPVGDLAKRALKASGQVLDLDPAAAATTMSPVATRNIRKSVDMLQTGTYRDDSGRKVIDTTVPEAIMKGIGFQPNSVAQVQEAAGEAQQMVAQTRLRGTELTQQMAQAVFEKDQGKVAEVRAMVARWNENNPEAPVKISMPSVLARVRAMREDKATRLANAAPKAVRAEVRRQMADATP